MSKRNPVLDGENSDAFVLGWATTDRGALRVARRWARDRRLDQVPCGTHRCTVALRYDPDVMDPLETERANGRQGYVVEWRDL